MLKPFILDVAAGVSLPKRVSDHPDVGADGFAFIQKTIGQYCEYAITAEEAYSNINGLVSDKEFLTAEFPEIATLIQDEERRAFFQLRHLLEYPKVKSFCCKVVHCFNW